MPALSSNLMPRSGLSRDPGQRSVRSTLERLGNVLYSEGNLHEAQSFYQQALRFDAGKP